MNDYLYRCTADKDTNGNEYGYCLCGKAVPPEKGGYYCGDKYGRYAADYCSAKCGFAVKIDEQLRLTDL